MFPSNVRVDEVDPLDLIRAGVARLAAEDRSEWSDAARSELLVGLLGVSERLRAEVVRETGEWDARQAWAADGALSASSWVAHRAPLAKRDANELVRAARLAFHHEATAAALATGALTASKLDVLAAAVRGRMRLFERDEHVLLEISPTVGVDDFATAAKYWRSCADDVLAREDALHVFETREVTLVSTLEGRVDVHASLDSEGGKIVSAAFDAYDRPDSENGIEDPRTLAQRRADALVQICSEAVGRKQAESGLHHTPTVDLVYDVARMPGRTFQGAPQGASKCVSPSIAGVFGRREIPGIGPVGLDTARRIACDAAVSRIVMRGESEVLDLGRSARLVNRVMRRALQHRDRGCVFPGCTAPVRWCDAHHLIHWEDGGPTSLENLVLLCRRHHVACHEGGWQLVRPPAGLVEITARGAPTGTKDRTRPTNRGPTVATRDERGNGMERERGSGGDNRQPALATAGGGPWPSSTPESQRGCSEI
jgi:hypothetical protein